MNRSSKTLVVLAMAVVVLAAAVEALPKGHLERLGRTIHEDAVLGSSDPLILTNYLHDPAMARSLSKVMGVGSFPSYSGYFTVNATFGSNMFFWYFPAQNGNAQAPLVMFLQGGPGASSMFGLFSEMGPYTVAADGKTLVPNPNTWNKEYALVFVDNPVGAGWSFTQDVRGFVRNEDDVARNLYSLLEQFFTVFDSLQTVDFYIAGESYAGHYVPAISHEIWVRNQRSPKLHINLVGISIGDGSIDPQIQFASMGDLWFRTGLASLKEVRLIAEYERQFETAVRNKEYTKAFHVFDQLLNGDFWPYGTLFENITGLTNYFNFLEPNYPANPYPTYLNLPSTRAAIHVGASAYWDYNSTVEYHLIPDWMTSVTHFLVPVLNNYKVLIYTGQLDIILGSAANEAYLETINWKHAQEYRASDKKIWYLNDNTNNPPLGYARSAGNFRQVVVRNAGHLLPQDQPVSALDMITRFISNTPF